jgi:hypothetical protein
MVPFNKGFSGSVRRAQRNIGNSEWPETNRKKDVQFLEQRAGRDQIPNGIRSKQPWQDPIPIPQSIGTGSRLWKTEAGNFVQVPVKLLDLPLEVCPSGRRGTDKQ